MKKIISIIIIALFTISALPVFASITNFKDLVDNVFIGGVLRPIVPLLIGLAVVMFVYGVLILMFSEAGEKKEEGKQYMLWGIIGIFVMVSVWGLVNVLKGVFDFDTNQQQNIDINIPKIDVKIGG